ncbi:type I polyketide synthase, partial [Mycobacterium simulans]|uniref:type I polyketide synthase n=1 Tax=Mycobacterium simulans TaxID=627089 RepID=UPI0017485E21
VLAVIAGSAVNQDGASNGLTAPNGPAQQRVITQAVANAGIGLDQVDVVEAHGTGTRLGDPIEAGALLATYGAHRSPEDPVWLGSIKSNIGHTQAAAGAAGLIKMVLALNHDILPPTLHVDEPNPHIDWSAGAVRLLTEPVPWPQTGHPRTAGVSSFGISGTNAHVILQQAPPASVAALDPANSIPAAAPLHIWPISARTPAALAAQADRLSRHLAAHPDLDVIDVAHSLAITRTQHPYRAAITAGGAGADTHTELVAGLEALASGQAHPRLTQHYLPGQASSQLVFVLPGQGGQHPGMGRQLYERHRRFAEAVDDCDDALRPFTGWSVRDVVCQDSAAPSLDRVDVVQPVLFTLMVALAEVLERCGIVPDAVIGHSQGEIAAAYIGGVFSLDEAAKIVALRSRALAGLAGSGAMASVLVSAQDLAPRLQPWARALSIAATNGPSYTVISGEPTALVQFIDSCERDDIQVRGLAVDYASHSDHVEQLREQLLNDLAGLAPQASRVPLYSTVASAISEQALDTTSMDARYWYHNLREPVRFHDGVSRLLAQGEQMFVELSPHPVLAPAISDTVAHTPQRSQSLVVSTLHRDRADLDALAAAVGRLHTCGHSPSWRQLYPRGRVVGLPTYPFEHHRYWLAPAAAADVSAAGLAQVEHPLLGAVTGLVDDDQVVVMTGRLSTSTQSWLAGHVVGDGVVVPATAYIDMLLAAGERAGCPVIAELVIQARLRLTEDAPTDVQITVQPVDEGGRRRFSVHSRTGGQHSSSGWVLHATGVLSGSGQHPVDGPVAVPAGTVEPIDTDDFYGGLAGRGLVLGDLFRSVRSIGHDPVDPNIGYAEVELPAGADVAGYGIHPALLDATFQVVGSGLFDGSAPAAEPTVLRVPFAVSGVVLHATAATRLQVVMTCLDAETFRVLAVDAAGEPVLSIDRVTMRALPEQLPQSSAAGGEGLFDLSWVELAGDSWEAAGGEAAGDGSGWVVLVDGSDRVPAG